MNFLITVSTFLPFAVTYFWPRRRLKNMQKVSNASAKLFSEIFNWILKSRFRSFNTALQSAVLVIFVVQRLQFFNSLLIFPRVTFSFDFSLHLSLIKSACVPSDTSELLVAFVRSKKQYWRFINSCNRKKVDWMIFQSISKRLMSSAAVSLMSLLAYFSFRKINSITFNPLPRSFRCVL